MAAMCNKETGKNTCSCNPLVHCSLSLSQGGRRRGKWRISWTVIFRGTWYWRLWPNGWSALYHSVWTNCLHTRIIRVKGQRISSHNFQLDKISHRQGLEHADDILMTHWSNWHTIHPHQGVASLQPTIFCCGTIGYNTLDLEEFANLIPSNNGEAKSTGAFEKLSSYELTLQLLAINGVRITSWLMIGVVYSVCWRQGLRKFNSWPPEGNTKKKTRTKFNFLKFIIDSIFKDNWKIKRQLK